VETAVQGGKCHVLPWNSQRTFHEFDLYWSVPQELELLNYLSCNMSPWRRQQYAYASVAEDLYDRKLNTKEEEEEFKEMKLCGAKQF
jgi:hypothetical protein